MIPVLIIKRALRDSVQVQRKVDGESVRRQVRDDPEEIRPPGRGARGEHHAEAPAPAASAAVRSLRRPRQKGDGSSFRVVSIALQYMSIVLIRSDDQETVLVVGVSKSRLCIRSYVHQIDV